MTTIRPSPDVATRVSAALAAVFARAAADPDRENPPSLDDIRAQLRKRDTPARQMEFLHPADNDSLLVELDALIEEVGGQALAGDFVAAQASEALSRVIDAAIGDPTLPKAISLGVLREAMAGGLIARLAGNGALDEDDDAALLAEVESLIERHGEGAPAELFIRYE